MGIIKTKVLNVPLGFSSHDFCFVIFFFILGQMRSMIHLSTFFIQLPNVAPPPPLPKMHSDSPLCCSLDSISLGEKLAQAMQHAQKNPALGGCAGHEALENRMT